MRKGIVEPIFGMDVLHYCTLLETAFAGNLSIELTERAHQLSLNCLGNYR